MRVFFLIALVALLFAQIHIVYAWNATGHMVVADIAYDRLSPRAKKGIDTLLQRHRDYALWMSQMPAGYADRARFAFMKAATWPDDIRHTPDDRPAWHYIDIPVIAPGDKPDPTALTIPVPNVQTQILLETQLLTSKRATDADRAIALCWVEHLVGDIHQPLHDATFFSPLFPQGDRGGNDETLPVGAAPGDQLEARPRPKKLHALWDDLLGQTQDPAQIQTLAAALETPAFARKTYPQIANHKSVAAWAKEGNILAQNIAYQHGLLPMTQTGNSQAQVTLPPGYLDTAQHLARRQIALAAWRLADLLNAQTYPAFSTAPPITAPPSLPTRPDAAHAPFIGNRRSHVVHPPSDNGTLPAEKNRVYFKTLDEAQKAGYHLP